MDQEKVKLDEMDIENVSGGINTDVAQEVDFVEPLDPDVGKGRPIITRPIPVPKPAPNPIYDHPEG